MSMCPSCGYQGDLTLHQQGRYIIGACPSCGVGLSIQLNYSQDGASQAVSVQQTGPRPMDTDAYKLAPTGPHKTVSAGTRGAGRVTSSRTASSERSSRRVLIVCSTNDIADAVREAAQESGRLDGVGCFGDNRTLIEQFCRAIKDDTKPKLLVLDSDAHPIPALEALTIVRSIEAGLNENRTPILLLGSKEQEAELKPVLSGLGNARFVRRGQDSAAASQGPRIVGLVEKILKRGK